MIRALTHGAAALACVLALAGGARRAEAHAQGTVFSSAVDGDGLALFWNPAAMAASPGSRFDLVGNLSILTSTYQRAGIDTGQTGRPFPVASLASIRPEPAAGLILDKLWHRRLRIGLAFTVPSAAGAAWPQTVNDGGQTVLGPTRYHVTSAQVFTALAQLGASIALHPTFAIGAAVNIAISHIDVQKDVDLANQGGLHCAQNPLGCETPGLSAPLALLGTGVSAGASVGVMWQPIPRLRIGVAYISPITVDVAVSIGIDARKVSDLAQRFVPGFATLAVSGSGSVQMTTPQRVHFAIAGDVHPRVELAAFLVWINASATEIIDGTITNKSSTLVPDTLRIPSIKNDGWVMTARIVGRVRERWRLGLSIEYGRRSVPESYMSPSNLDFDVVTFNLGANLRVWKRLYLGASFSQSIVAPRTIEKSDFSNDSTPPYNFPNPSGSYTGNSEKLGLDVSTTF